MSSEVIVVLPAFQLAMSILPGVNITSLQFSSPKGLPGVLRLDSSMVVKPLGQRFEQDTLLNAPYTLHVFFETIQPYVYTGTQVQ